MLNEDKLKELLNNPVLFICLILAFVPLFGAYFAIDSNILSYLFAGCGALCVYLSVKRKDLLSNAPSLFVVFLLAYMFFNIRAVGNNFWVLAYGGVLFFVALYSTKLFDVEILFIVGIFLFSSFIHAVPAFITDYVEEIDPYYDYKWAQEIFSTGAVPEHDWMTYPLKGGLDRSLMPFGNPVAIAIFGRLFEFVNMGLLQSTLLLSAVAAGLTPVIVYFLLKELMYNRENVKLAAMFGVIALVLSNGWSTKAHATDSENDGFGAFIMFSTLFIYMYAVNRKNFILTIVGGSLMFGWFTTFWDGYKLLVMFLGIAVAMLSVVGAFAKFRTFEYLKHLLAMFLLGNFLWRLVLHPGGEIFSFIPFKGIEMAALGLAILAVGFNEYIINYRHKVSTNQEALFGVGIVILLIIFGPAIYTNFYNVAITDARQSSVVFKTIAEQAPFASTIKDYLTGIIKLCGIGAFLSLCAIPILCYFIIKEKDFGSAVMLSWLGPMIWGLYFKSQYNFIASIPYALAGSWVVLFVMTQKEHQDGIRIIPTLLVLYAVLAYTPLASLISNYEPAQIFYNVATYDRIGWETTLQYFKTLPTNTAIITWWDYGHWITSVSHRFVLIDNLQNDHWEIQDVARFFMRAENEDDAFKIIQKYQDTYQKEPYKSKFGGVNLSEVAIDWTMIGKSGAMRFIATGNLTNQADGEYDSYTQCGFSPQNSNINGSLTTAPDGKFIMTKMLVFPCTENKDGLAGVIITIGQDNSLGAQAVDINGNRISWNAWMASKDGSLFGVKSLDEVLSVSMQYADKLQNVPPAYYNLVYGSGKFKNFMFARLYFSTNIESYKKAGLANVDWSAPKYFTKDKSFEEGFVETWKINYPTQQGAAPVIQAPKNTTGVFKYGAN